MNNQDSQPTANQRDVTVVFYKKNIEILVENKINKLFFFSTTGG